MATVVAGFFIIACFLGGRVTVPPGEDLAGIRLVIAQTGETAGITDSGGYYAIELPDSTGRETLVEFWREGRFLASHVLTCDRPVTLPLGGLDYQLETVRVRAPALELTHDGEAIRAESIPLDAVRSAGAVLPSVAEAVRQEPGVGATGRDGFTSSPTIRGLGRGRSLVLLEGMRLSSDRGVGPSASFLDPLLLGSVEIVRGTSGVAYGSGALGGAILLGLESPTDFLAGAARVSGSTNGAGRAAGARIAGPLGSGWRGSLSGFARGQDDYRFPAGDRFGGGDAPNSGFGNGGGAMVLAREGAASWRFTLLGTAARDVGRATTIARRIDTISEEDHAFASVAVAAGRGPWRLSANGGYHRPRTVNVSERLDADLNPTSVTSTENVSRDASLTLRAERGAGATTWLAGLDAFARWNVDAVEDRRDFTDGAATTHVVTELVANARRADVGVYAGWRRQIRLTGQVMVTGRLDLASREADMRPAASWVAPSLDARLILPIDVRWAVTGGVGRAFRAPRIQELYFAGDRPGGSRLANPDLDPETAWAAEAGALYGKGPWRGRIAAWGLLASDLIVQLPVDAGGDTLRHANVSEGRLFGVEASMRWTAPGARATLEAGYAFVHGDDEHGTPLPDVPPGEIRLAATARVAGTAEAPRLVGRTSLRAGAAKTPPADGAAARWWSDLLGSTKTGGDELGHPGFARWDIGARWTPRRGLAVDLAVVNLLDSRYIDRPEADAWPEPGRSAALELALTW